MALGVLYRDPELYSLSEYVHILEAGPTFPELQI